MTAMVMTAADGSQELMLYGIVGADDYWDVGFCAADVVCALAQINPATAINVRINSPGGNPWEGIAIYNLLAQFAGGVNIFIDGVALSAASVVAMAGAKVTMRTGAILMIHDPATDTSGTAADHQQNLAMLENAAAAMAEVYAKKTGKPVADMRVLMQAETWMTAEQAIAAGFADAEAPAEAVEATAFDYRTFAGAPQRLTALAQSKGWKRPPAAKHPPQADDVQPNHEQEASMADNDRKAGAAEATARASTIIKACTKAGFSILAERLIANGADDPTVTAQLEEAAQAKTRFEAAHRSKPKAVAADMLDKHLASGKPLADFSSSLVDALAAAEKEEPATRSQHTGDDGKPAAGIDPAKIYASHNAAFGRRAV